MHGWSAVHSAVWHGDRDMTSALLRHGGRLYATAEAAEDARAAGVAPPAGDAIDHAALPLKRILETPGHALDDGEHVVRYY